MAVIICVFPVLHSALADDVWDPFNGDKEVNIVYLGGSITAAEGYRTHIGNYIKAAYEKIVQDRKINNYNAGVGGTGSDYGLIRLQEDVISKNPDLVFVEFAVNDGWSGDAGSEKKAGIISSMERIVRSLQSLESPPMIIYIYTTGTTFKNCYDIHTQVADYYNIPEINFLQYMLDSGFTGSEKGTPYDSLSGRLKANYGDLIHPNSSGHKLWGDYAVAELSKNPQKYFRHPMLRQNAINASQDSGVFAKYVSAKEAFDNGSLIIKNAAGASGKENSDYFFEGNGTLRLAEVGVKAVFNFSGGVIASKVLVEASDSTVFENNLDGGAYTDTGSCFYGGEAGFVKNGLNNTKHTLEITVSQPRPTGSKGDNIRIRGFFIDSMEALDYPFNYPENTKINVWAEMAEKKEEKEAEQEIYSKDISLITALGINLDNENEPLEHDDKVTRAHFAQAISNLCRLDVNDGFSAWRAMFYKSDDNEVIKRAEKPAENRFTDVFQEHWAAEFIRLVTDFGMMNGASSDSFEPDKAITVNEAVKTLLVILGYKGKAEVYGGYPDGYMRTARELGLLKSLNADGKHLLTYGEAARLISVCLEVELLQMTTVGSDVRYEAFKGETVLSRSLKLKKATGILNDNGITNLTGESEISKNHVKIDNTVCKLSEKAVYAREFIGRNVTVYYTIDDDDSHILVYAFPSGRDSELTFDISDFVSLSGNGIEYEKNDIIKKANIRLAPYMIFNGMALKSFDENNFNFDTGTVTLIANDGGAIYNTIVVNAYRSWFVSAVDSTGFIVYNKSAADINIPDEFMLELDIRDYTSDITILNSNMEAAKFEDIKKGGLIDVSVNGNVKKVIICSRKITDFSVEAITVEDDYTIISGNGRQYIISKDYMSAQNKIEVKTGGIYNLYLNSIGKTGWIEPSEAANELAAGYMINAIRQSKDIDNTPEFKLLTVKGEVGIYKASERIRIENTDGTEKTYKASDLADFVISYRGLLRYKLDKDKKISHLELPLADVNNGRNPDRLGLFKEMSSADGEYISPSQQFGANVHINDNTLIFSFNEQLPLDDTSYKIIKRANLVDGREYNGKAYNTVDGSPYAEFVVIYTASSDLRLDRAHNKTFLVVTSVVNSVNSEGEYGVMVHGVSMANDAAVLNTKIFSKINTTVNAAGNSCSAFEAASDGVQSGAEYVVKKGDIIRYQIINENVEQVEVLYRSDEINPAFPEGRKGNLSGTTGIFDTAALGRTNPYAISSDSSLRTTDQKNFGIGELRMVYGSIHSVYSNIIKYTTQELSGSVYDPNDGGGIYVTESVKIPNAVMTVTYKNGTVQAVKGSISDIRSFKDAGAGCSRIIVQTRSGRVEKLFIINGEAN